MKPNRYLSWKKAIDFEQIKSKRSSLDTRIAVKRERAQRCPEDCLEVEKEIADLNTRILELDALLAKEPPLPELPPLQPLVKVGGILDEIQTMVVKGYFSAREYEPDEFARQESRRQWGSVLLAAIGESAAATVNAQDEIRSADVYHFIQGKIDGKPFYGWTGMVTARAGEVCKPFSIPFCAVNAFFETARKKKCRLHQRRHIQDNASQIRTFG